MYRPSCMVWMGRKQVVHLEQGEGLGYLSSSTLLDEGISHFHSRVHTTRAFGSFNIQNHVHTLLDFDQALLTLRRAGWPDIYRHTLPGGIE